MKPSARLLRALKPLTSDYTFSSRSPAIYSLGLSYASKNSPPFVPKNERAPRYGYAGYRNDHGAALISEWVKSSLDRRAGRGELTVDKPGGWDERLQDETRRWGAGEDFYAVDVPETSSSSSSDPPVHFAISDGVGGWSDVVDPSFFSQALMYHYAKSSSSLETAHPRAILKQAYERVLKEESVVAGSATACGIAVDSKGVLRGVNMGDSGCTILRDGKVIFETPALTHYFNCPTQLTKTPKGMDASGVVRDQPDNEKCSDTFEAQLQPGDIILLYTDGLSDNVPSAHFPLLLSHLRGIMDHPDNADLSPAERDSELARLFADVLVAYGRRAMVRTGEEVDESGKPSWKTPFEVEAKKAGLNFKGGKIDDITVLASVVSELHPE
ncbi:phosphatase 2C-like domain-containing protein [Kockovaella imperatae]|uniref:Protein phosphatase n=1 Tax=Kockovaella imperatae TaxID=4999 RepID=A0A1Y1UL85_9TREE|nr:phosphatase 2C-like domain-containing protein [Kockovaella imperatae]ORX38264.1 phosphatase 2C-like domain-containing protein [Kockovaella imperatae]